MGVVSEFIQNYWKEFEGLFFLFIYYYGSFFPDLGVGGEGCKRTKTKTWIGKHATGTAKTEIHTVLVERGMSWSEVQEKWAELSGDLEGFYLSHQVCLATRLLFAAMASVVKD